jgi:hypothetical protein
MDVVPIAVTALTFVLLALLVLHGGSGPGQQRPGLDDEDPGDGGGGGGGPRRDRPVPPTGPGDADPPWWAEFERELAAYTAQRAREPAELTSR